MQQGKFKFTCMKGKSFKLAQYFEVDHVRCMYWIFSCPLHLMIHLLLTQRFITPYDCIGKHFEVPYHVNI